MTNQTKASPHFSKVVDLRSRAAMTEFLTSHFRYDTNNSNNNSTSYAHCVKVQKLALSRDQLTKAYSYFDADESEWYERAQIIARFTRQMNGKFTIGSNGRSGGYLVLYASEYKASDYKSHCLSCGQQNFQAVSETSGNKCGRCGIAGEAGRINYASIPVELSTFPCRSIDMYEEFDADGWNIDTLRNRVKLVQAFDAACDEIRDSFLEMLDSSELVEEEVVIVKKVTRFATID